MGLGMAVSDSDRATVRVGQKGKYHLLYRYRFQQHEMGKDSSGTEREGRTSRSAKICFSNQYEPRDTYATECDCWIFRAINR